MAKRILEKTAFNLAVCVFVYGLIMCFSRFDRVYAGWFAGLAGAVYLLIGWLFYLKAKGTDFTKLLKRKKPQSVPYYLQSPAEKRKGPRIGLNSPRHTTDDELDDADEQRESELTFKQQCSSRALAYALNGILMLALSAI